MSKQTEERLAELEDAGFGASYELDGDVLIRCDQCDATIINGVPCHEEGCPEYAAVLRRKMREDREEDFLDDVDDVDEDGLWELEYDE